MTGRADVFLRACTQLILWVFAHYALEWLFQATKTSVVSASPLRDRVLILFAAPLEALFILGAAQIVLAGADSLRRDARAYPLAALLPSAVATVLAVVAVDNFTKTVFGFGIVDARSHTLVLYFAAVALLAAWTLRARAFDLARPRAWRGRAIGALSLVTCAAAAYAVLAAETPASNIATQTSATARASAPNVLLVGIDGITAAHSSAYGYPRPTMPNLERLAARGILFENAFSNAGRTFGSLTSILTGKPPTETHVLFPPTYLTGRHAFEHVPGLLRRAGYTTAQIGMRHYADAEEWNLRGGFDVVNGRRLIAPERERSAGRERLTRFQKQVRDRVVERVRHLIGLGPVEDEYAFLVKGGRSPYFADERRLELAHEFLKTARQPWLLHIHLIDSHCCAEWNAAKQGRTEAEVYDDVLRASDRTLGRLVDIVASAAGHLDRTMIIVYSDHDRSWGTLERIPLVVVPPGQTKARRVRTNVQLLDLAPTILEAAGISKPAWMSGESLLHAETLDPRRPIFSLVRIAERTGAGPRMSRLVDAGPPLYGARTAAVVICDTAVEMRLPDGRWRAGQLPGHTSPCNERLDRVGHALLVAHLRQHGYPVGSGAPPAVAERPGR